MDRINDLLTKEQAKLTELKEKRQKIDEKIKATETNILKYQGMLDQKKFSEVNDVLNSTGLSLEEVMSAIKNGDLLALQDKLLTKENHNGEN